MHRKQLTKGYTNFRRLAKLMFSRPADFVWFLQSLRRWRAMAGPTWQPSFADLFPITRERFASSGDARGHYFLQDLWASRHVFMRNPGKHADVGSSLSGFVAHVASFCSVVYVDIRPLECCVPNIVWQNGSIVDLPFKNDSVESLSCLHVIEHVGLGRYGDPIDPNGWLKGLDELSRVLSPGGQLLVGTPIGKRRLQFNAHRIFRPEDITQALSNLRLLEFSLVPNEGSTSWIEDADPASTSDMAYACGLFRFTKDHES